MPSVPPSRTLALALLACALVACDDGPTGGAISFPPPNLALLLGQDGRVQAVTGAGAPAPRTIARLGGFVGGCVARVDRGRAVLLSRFDSAGGSRRFTVIDAERGTVLRELPHAQVERTAPDTARLELFAPFRCTVDATGTRLATNARLNGRIGIAIVALDSARYAGFVRTDGFQTSAAFFTWRGRPAILVARYPTPVVPFARLFLYAHDATTLAVFDSTLVPGSEQVFDVRLLPLPSANGVAVAHGGRISFCHQQFGCGTSRVGAPPLRTLGTWTNGTGFTTLLGTTVRVERGRFRGEAWVLSPGGEPFETHDLGELLPIDIATDPLSGLWIVAGTLRTGWGIGPVPHGGTQRPGDATAIVDDPGPPIGLPLPDVLLVYDPVARRVVRRAPIPVGTVALVGVR